MNTTAVHIDTQLFNKVAEYALKKHTSVEKFMEGLIIALPPTLPEQNNDAWENYEISEETMSLTVKHRQNIPDNYDKLLKAKLAERLL